MKNDACMQLLGSKQYDFVNPDPASINIRSMGAVLARTPRFAGHTESGVLSVAQHCVEGAKAILRETGNRLAAAAFLVHDGHEYVIGDDTRPKVQALALIAAEFAMEMYGHAELNAGEKAAYWVRTAFREMKRRADSVIYPAAGLPWPLPAAISAIVKKYDVRMLRTERDLRMAKSPAPWAPDVESATPIEGVDCSVWGESLAYALWMGAAYELLKFTVDNVPAPCDGCPQCATGELDAPLVPAVANADSSCGFERSMEPDGHCPECCMPWLGNNRPNRCVKLDDLVAA